MLEETPRLFCIHFWANDDAKALATTLRRIELTIVERSGLCIAQKFDRRNADQATAIRIVTRSRMEASVIRPRQHKPRTPTTVRVWLSKLAIWRDPSHCRSHKAHNLNQLAVALRLHLSRLDGDENRTDRE